MNFPDYITVPASEVIDLLKENGLIMTTAESCTGGLISAVITEISGASAVIQGGYTTYCNEEKMKKVGVSAELLANYGPVSEQVAKAMAKGAVENSYGSDIGVSVTGYADLDPNNPDAKIGQVYIGLFKKNSEDAIAVEFNFKGNRSQIRIQAVKETLNLLKNNI